MSIHVIITDDHPVVRDGLRFAIERSDADIVVVAEAGNGQELLDLPAEPGADVYIMDVTMPILNGIEATRRLIHRDPSAKVVMLSLHSSDSVVRESMQAGARGFLTKETATRCVAEATIEVHRGGYYMSPDVAQGIGSVLQAEREGVAARSPTGRPLTRQEYRVLQLVGEGLSEKEIAALLERSVNTVHKHRTNLMAKLDIHDQVSLARYALREGIAKP